MFTNNNNNTETIINEDFKMEDLNGFSDNEANLINNELFQPFSIFGNENTNDKISQKFSSESFNDDDFFINRKRMRDRADMFEEENKNTEIKEINEPIKQKSIKKELNSTSTSFKPMSFSCLFPKKETINKEKTNNENEKTKISKKNEMSQKSFNLNFNLNSKISQKTEINKPFQFFNKTLTNTNIEKPQNEKNKAIEQINNKPMNENHIVTQQNSSKLGFTFPNFKNTNQKEATQASSLTIKNSFSTLLNANLIEKENEQNKISKNESKIPNFIFNKPPVITPCQLNSTKDSSNKNFGFASIALNMNSKPNTFNFLLKPKENEKILKKEENKEWSNIGNLFQQVRNFIKEEEEKEENFDSLSEKKSLNSSYEPSEKQSQFLPMNLNSNSNEKNSKISKKTNDIDKIISEGKQDDKIKFENLITFEKTNDFENIILNEVKPIIIEKPELNTNEIEINPCNLFKQASIKNSITKENENNEINDDINKEAENIIHIKKENKNDLFLLSIEKELCKLQNEIFSSQRFFF